MDMEGVAEKVLVQEITRKLRGGMYVEFKVESLLQPFMEFRLFPVRELVHGFGHWKHVSLILYGLPSMFNTENRRKKKLYRKHLNEFKERFEQTMMDIQVSEMPKGGLSWNTINLWATAMNGKPVIDVKPILVLMNRSFKGCGEIFGKRSQNPVKAWYESGVPGRAQIVAYVELEADRFILLYKNLKYELPLLREPLQKVMA